MNLLTKRIGYFEYFTWNYVWGIRSIFTENNKQFVKTLWSYNNEGNV